MINLIDKQNCSLSQLTIILDKDNVLNSDEILKFLTNYDYYNATKIQKDFWNTRLQDFDVLWGSIENYENTIATYDYIELDTKKTYEKLFTRKEFLKWIFHAYSNFCYISLRTKNLYDFKDLIQNVYPNSYRIVVMNSKDSAEIFKDYESLLNNFNFTLKNDEIKPLNSNSDTSILKYIDFNAYKPEPLKEPEPEIKKPENVKYVKAYEDFA